MTGKKSKLGILLLTLLLISSVVGSVMVAESGLLAEGESQIEKGKGQQSGVQTLLKVMVERRRSLQRQLIEHVQLTIFAIGLAILVGVSTGILLTRSRTLAPPVLGIASVIQTIPSLALLALMIPLLGIGLVPAVAALFLYALLPIMRNTYTAIDEVDPAIIEVGRGMGMTERQILLKLEIPLCVPMVMAGIRTSTVICVGIATLCTFIGAGGLGTMIMEGMQTRGSVLIMAGVIPAIVLALLLDGFMALMQRLLVPTGLKLQE
jgi:osmoprotectant transport system permease protein